MSELPLALQILPGGFHSCFDSKVHLHRPIMTPTGPSLELAFGSWEDNIKINVIFVAQTSLRLFFEQEVQRRLSHRFQSDCTAERQGLE